MGKKKKEVLASAEAWAREHLAQLGKGNALTKAIDDAVKAAKHVESSKAAHNAAKTTLAQSLASVEIELKGAKSALRDKAVAEKPSAKKPAPAKEAVVPKAAETGTARAAKAVKPAAKESVDAAPKPAARKAAAPETKATATKK